MDDVIKMQLLKLEGRKWIFFASKGELEFPNLFYLP